MFARVGDATDLVQKEMYRFTDAGGRDVALRPEFTAAVCRAFVEHRPATPWKVWSGGPLLRYERPQRGRYRQFEQVNLEVLGSDDPMVDVEVIALGWRFFERLGLRQVTLLVNSLGHPRRTGGLRRGAAPLLHRQPRCAVRPERGDARPQSAARPRLQAPRGRRPDHGRADDRRVATARRRSPISRRCRPGSSWSTSPSRSPHVSSGASTTTSARRSSSPAARWTSAQNALGGGGRYDGLVEALGGPPTPGIGFALGVDRGLLACDDEEVFDAPATIGRRVRRRHDGRGGRLGDHRGAARGPAISADRAFDNRSMKSQMKAADRSGATTAIIVGPDELDAGEVLVRPLRADGEQSRASTRDRRSSTHLTTRRS